MVQDICRDSCHTRWLFSNTSNETHHTYRYVKETYGDKLEICNPKKGFYTWCKETLFIPNQVNRACCNEFKEWLSLQYLKDYIKKPCLHIVGIRACESKSRSEYEQVRKGKWKNKKAMQNWWMYLPILDFTDYDVWAYLFHYDLKFNELYKFGYNRVGCTNCPYRSDYELELNKHFLPVYYQQWQKLLEYVFKEGGFSINLNCTLQEFLGGWWRNGVKRDEPTEEVIEEFCKFKNISREEAMKYFSVNRCTKCGGRLSKDMIALNMKLFGHSTNSRICLKCLARDLGTSKKELKKMIEEFKEQGCKLF